jgi:hypothetical protein
MFFTRQAFSISIPLITPWDPILDPCGKRVILTSIREIQIKIMYVFYPSNIFHFRSFGCFLGCHSGSLLQKYDPDKCEQNSNKSRLCFLAIRHCPRSLLWLSLGVPSWILAAKV